MKRATLCLALSTLACANPCGGNKIPKPWSERHGSEIVVGNENSREAEHTVVERAELGEGETPGSQRLILAPNVRVDPPKIEDPLYEVEEADPDAVEASGTLDHCPEGTSLVDKRGERVSAMYCALPNGVRHGPELRFFPNGSIEELSCYTAGMRNGTVTTWDATGRKASIFQWVDGQPGPGRLLP